MKDATESRMRVLDHSCGPHARDRVLNQPDALRAYQTAVTGGR
jgi:hypothetical protein